TTKENVFVAGDITGIEEASTAMEEGRLAGINAAAELGYINEEEARIRSEEIWDSLNCLRSGYFGQKRRESKDLMLHTGNEVIQWKIH
ncbi:hypothetical protein SMA90_29090, partial [Escherichia coli]